MIGSMYKDREPIQHATDLACAALAEVIDPMADAETQLLALSELVYRAQAIIGIEQPSHSTTTSNRARASRETSHAPRHKSQDLSCAAQARGDHRAGT